jgi:hypothetical protein
VPLRMTHLLHNAGQSSGERGNSFKKSNLSNRGQIRTSIRISLRHVPAGFCQLHGRTFLPYDGPSNDQLKNVHGSSSQ